MSDDKHPIEAFDEEEKRRQALPDKLQDMANKVDQRSATGRHYRLEDPKFVRGLIYVGLFILGALLLAEGFYHHHGHFERDGIKIDELPEFFPAFGFLACLVMVLVSKAIGMVLKRKDTFYDAE